MYALLFIVTVLPFAGCFQFIDCGSKLGHFTEIAVTDCDPPNVAYCKLSRGHNATLTINFVPKNDLNTVIAVVHGILGGIPIPFDIPNPDCCKDSDLQCPLKANMNYTYIATLPVLSSYPKVNTKTTTSLFPIRIVKVLSLCWMTVGPEYGGTNGFLSASSQRKTLVQVKVLVKWELQSIDKQEIICFELPVKIS